MKHSVLHHSERGSVIIWILVAIGLFAALGFAFSKSSSNSISLLEDEQLEAKLNQFIAYGNDLRQTIKRLELRGCDETEISFYNTEPTASNHNNPNAPADGSCNVFSPNGGGLTWLIIPEKLKRTMGSAFALSSWDNYKIVGRTAVIGVGTSASDLTLLFVKSRNNPTAVKLCNILNDRYSIIYDIDAGAESVNTNDLDGFDGTYYAVPWAATTIGDGLTEFVGHKTGCFRESHGGSQLVYYHVIKAR